MSFMPVILGFIILHLTFLCVSPPHPPPMPAGSLWLTYTPCDGPSGVVMWWSCWGRQEPTSPGMSWRRQDQNSAGEIPQPLGVLKHNMATTLLFTPFFQRNTHTHRMRVLVQPDVPVLWKPQNVPRLHRCTTLTFLEFLTAVGKLPWVTSSCSRPPFVRLSHPRPLKTTVVWQCVSRQSSTRWKTMLMLKCKFDGLFSVSLACFSF